MRGVNGAALAIGTILVIGCADLEQQGPPTPHHELGDPCGSATESCIDDNTVQRCVNNVWSAVDCDEACTSLGPAYIAGVCVEETCDCILADPTACTPGDTTCEGASAVGVCSDSQTWELAECDERCQDSGLTSLGCVESEDESAACWCSAEGTPCVPNTPAVCAGSSTLAECVGVRWVFDDCGSSCGGEAICVGWETPSYCECA